MIKEKHFSLFKYADDMAIVSLLQKTDPLGEATSLAHTEALQTCCCISQLEINMAKTKELIICTKQVENSQFHLMANMEYIFTRCSQRLYLLRKLSDLSVSQQILELVYKLLLRVL